MTILTILTIVTIVINVIRAIIGHQEIALINFFDNSKNRSRNADSGSNTASSWLERTRAPPRSKSREKESRCTAAAFSSGR